MMTEIHKWSVAWLCSFINFLYLGLPRLSGMFYLAAISRYNVNRNQASLPFVLCYTVRNVAGPFIGCLSRKVKVETLILSGCILSSVGVGVCFFAEDINTVSILWGGIFGLGFGLSTILIPSVLNQHFDKYISNANGIAFGGECIAGFVLPPLYEFCLNTFGPSGSFLILSGLLLHGIPAAMLLRPPDKKPDASQGRADAEWGSWGSIDKAGCSGDNISKKAKQVHHEEELLNDNEVLRHLLDESKNCYGTSDIAIAIQKERTQSESASFSSDRTKLEYHPSDQYVISCSEASPHSKLSNGFKYKDVSSFPKFLLENSNNSHPGDASGIVHDVLVNRGDNGNVSPQIQTAISSDIITERTCNVTSKDSEQCLKTKSPNISSDSFSFHETNPDKTSDVVKPNGTNQNVFSNAASQIDDETSQDSTSKPSGSNTNCETVKKDSNGLDQVEICSEASQNSFSSLQKRVSREGTQRDDSNVPDQLCNETSLNASLPKSSCDPSSLARSRFDVSPDFDGPIPGPRLPPLISDQSESRERPCCPPTCSVFLDPAFLLILFTQSSSIFVATTFTTILVEFSIDAGVDSAVAVYVLMSFAAADMAGRFGLGWVTDGAWLSGVAFSALCFGVMGAVLLTAPVAYQGFGLVTAAVGVYGAVLGGLIVIGPVVVTEHIEKESVNVALASRFALFAPMSLVQSSMIGYFRDTLGSYNGILYLLGIICVICALLCFFIPPAARCRKVEPRESAVSA